MIISMIMMILLFVLLYYFAKFKIEAQKGAIARLEKVLGTKANVTNTRLHIYSFTISGIYNTRDVILSVVYGYIIPIRIFQSAPFMGSCTKVSVKLTPAQIEKYSTTKKQIGILAFLKALLGFPITRECCEYLEVTQGFVPVILFWPSAEDIRARMEKAIKKAQDL